MSNCFYNDKALTLYDPEENREVVHFFRARQDGTGEPERITHQRLAELLCMDGRGYDLAFTRFEKLCAGKRVAVMTRYEYWLDPKDADKVARNNVAALAEWEALKVRAAERNEFGVEKHDESSSWKGVALSIRALTSSEKMGERYGRDDVTRAHLSTLAEEFEKSDARKLAA